jgi:hypothetical protein
VTIEADSGWVPAVGDMIVQSDTYWPVIAVASATVFTVGYKYGSSSLDPEGVVAAYSGPTCEVAWAPKAGDNATTEHMFRDAVMAFESLYGAKTIEWSFQTDRYTAAQDETHELDLTLAHKPAAIRCRIPENTRRGRRLYPSFSSKQADQRWALEGISVDMIQTEPKVRNAA